MADAGREEQAPVAESWRLDRRVVRNAAGMKVTQSVNATQNGYMIEQIGLVMMSVAAS